MQGVEWSTNMGQTQLLPRFSELNSRKQHVAPTEREPETNTAGQIQEIRGRIIWVISDNANSEEGHYIRYKYDVITPEITAAYGGRQLCWAHALLKGTSPLLPEHLPHSPFWGLK